VRGRASRTQRKSLSHAPSRSMRERCCADPGWFRPPGSGTVPAHSASKTRVNALMARDRGEVQVRGLVQAELAVQRADFRGLDEAGMRHCHRMQRPFQLLEPKGKKSV
jgi:hypothetical protein